MPRNQVIEKKLRDLYKKNYEFTEPYNGKKGVHPAEIYCTDGGVYEIMDLFKEINLQDHVIGDHCGMRGGLIQVIIKTELALAAFKKSIDEKLANKITNAESERFSFFTYNTPQLKSSSKESLGFTADDIAKAFDIDASLITGLQEGLVKSIEIKTKDLDTANLIGDKIRKNLESANNRTYGGLIRPGGIFNRDPIVELSFDAMTDLQKAVSKNAKALKCGV